MAGIQCPKCKAALSKEVQSKLSPFLGIVGIAKCPECGEKIQWQRELHSKVKVGGRVFQAGLVLLLLLLVFKLLTGSVVQLYLWVLGFVLSIIGVLVTSSSRKDVRVEPVE